MKRLLSFVTIILSVRGFLSIDSSLKCARMGQQNDNVNTENAADDEEITSTSDYLEFNNKEIEKLTTPLNDEERLNIDSNGNIYFQDGEKLFVRRPNVENAIEIAGIVLAAYRNNPIFIDTNSNTTYVGTQNGLFAVRCGTKSVQIKVTENVTVDFGIIDNNGNIFFGTDGSNADRSEQLYVFKRKDNSLAKISGIETSLGSYPIESRGNRKKIAIDSKNNIYVGAYSNYVYLIKAGETAAIKIKDNRDNGGVTAIVIDRNDNVYCRTYADLYILKNNKFIKILETIDFIDLFLSVDSDDNVHFRIGSDEYVLKSKVMSAIEVTTGTDENIILDKNLLIRNNIFYFTTSAGSDGAETIYTIKLGEGNATLIFKTSKYHSIAIDRDNNIYFTGDSSKISNKIVPYVLRANAKAPVEIRGITSRLSSAYADDKNNVYFSASNGLHILNFDEVIPHRLRATGSLISSLVVAKDDNIYFGTDYDGAFLLKAGISEATRIDGINNKLGQYSPPAIEAFVDKNYDIVYLRTEDDALYKLMSGETVAHTVVEGAAVQFFLSDCHNNTFYLRENEVYAIKSGESIATKIATVLGQVLSVDIDSSGRLYFATTIGLQVLNSGESATFLVTDSLYISSLAIDNEDSVYVGTNDGAFVLKSGEQQATKINGIDGSVAKVLVNSYDVYFITNDGSRLFLLQNKLDLGKLFQNRMLGEIDDSRDETILNASNYVNIEGDYVLNRSKNKVVNKTETSATIVGVKGKYVGEFRVEFVIRNKEEKKYFVDIDFLKKAIFFHYINEHLFHYRKTKNIKNIDVFIDNLRFSPVDVSKDSTNSSFEFRSVCDMKKVTNTSPINQMFKFAECNYDGKETVTFEITTGINKPDIDSYNSLLTDADEFIVADYLLSNESSSEPITLSTSFELANKNHFTRETNVYNFSEPTQEIFVPPMKQFLVKYSVRTFINKIILKLAQKIQGVIVAKVTDQNDEQIIQITLRNAMQVLEKFSQLPAEVIINDDNSITFSGKAILTSQRESEPSVIRNFV